MTVTGLISSDLRHPHINYQDIWKCQTEQSHLFLEHLLMNFPFWWIESFSVDEVEAVDVVEPNPFSASFSSDRGI